MKLLLGDLLTQLAPEVLPADPSQQIPWVNAVCQHFYLVGKWAGTTVRWKGATTGVSFAIYQDANGFYYFTLPRNLHSLLGAAFSVSQPVGSAQNYRVRFSSVPIQGPWHQFGNGGAGNIDGSWGSGVLDLGDGFTCFQDLPDNSYLQVMTETAEASGATMTFRGLDQNGNQIYSGSGAGTINGVTLNISTGLVTQTTQIFSAIPQLVKKPLTYGPVTLLAVSVATGKVTPIAIYDPSDTSPGFRRYRLGRSAQGGIPYCTVHAMTKRRFVPVLVNTDEVIPGNVPAIELGMHGRRYDLENDTKTADEYWGEAIALLNSELNEYNGAAMPQIIFGRDTNLARIARI